VCGDQHTVNCCNANGPSLCDYKGANIDDIYQYQYQYQLFVLTARGSNW
jgi:hypothetical protein